MRKRLTLILILVATSVCVAAFASNASAGTWISASGEYGPSATSEPDGMCEFFGLYAGTYTRNLTFLPPTVYARNITSGWGNDWRWVRYKARVVNYWTGQTVYDPGASGWSAWQVAWDNSPAPLSGQRYSISSETPIGNLTIQYDIEWWTQTSRVGTATLEPNSFNWLNDFSYNPPSGGTTSGC